MRQTIKQTFVAPEAVMLTTADDGTRYVTDRFIAWRMDALPVKAHAALTYLADGAYAISSTGAISPAKNGFANATPPRGESLAQIIGTDSGESVTRTTVTVDSGKYGVRVYVSADGTLAGVNGLLDFDGYQLTTSPKCGRYVITKGGDVVGTVMHVRITDQLSELTRLTAAPVAAVA